MKTEFVHIDTSSSASKGEVVKKPKPAPTPIAHNP
jgi:hypothetical protein